MACVVIKLIPRSVCNCNNQPAVAPTVTTTNTPAAAVSAQAATMDPGKIAATSAATPPAEPAEETKKSNWWKWALGGLAVIGLIAATGDKDKKKDNKKGNRR